MMMATHHDTLWAKLHQLELQLAAYKLLRAARVNGDDAAVLGFAFADGAQTPGGGGIGTCRGRQYDAYMRRRDARRVAASAEHQQQPANRKAQQPRGVRATPMSPRGALRCGAARDTQQEAGGGATPRLVVIAPAKRTPAVSSSIPTTPRRDGAALPRSRTVSGGGGAAGSPARLTSHHQRRNSLGVLAEFGECATPRPFLKRSTGTGGAAAPARLRATTRVHDLPAVDVPATTPRPQQQEHAPQAAPRHARSVSELPFDTAAAALASPQARARKRWGSPERPTAAMFSAADSRRDLSKGLKKLLSFVKKGGRSGGGGGDQPVPAAPSPRGSGKPVSKGWSGCSHVDVPFDRASLEGHRFPMTRAVGISG